MWRTKVFHSVPGVSNPLSNCISHLPKFQRPIFISKSLFLLKWKSYLWKFGFEIATYSNFVKTLQFCQNAPISSCMCWWWLLSGLVSQPFREDVVSNFVKNKYTKENVFFYSKNFFLKILNAKSSLLNFEETTVIHIVAVFVQLCANNAIHLLIAKICWQGIFLKKSFSHGLLAAYMCCILPLSK